jgi:uncharacterized FlaG/YvyC family protein
MNFFKPDRISLFGFEEKMKRRHTRRCAMSDQFSVSRVATNNANQEYNYHATHQAQQQQNTITQSAVKNVEQPEKKSQTKDQNEEERKQENAMRTPFRSIEMQFDVNQDTNQVTLTMLDKETKEVIRTIPETEWDKLSVSELFKIGV